MQLAGRLRSCSRARLPPQVLTGQLGWWELLAQVPTWQHTVECQCIAGLICRHSETASLGDIDRPSNIKARALPVPHTPAELHC